jgi:hypothetical protein
MIWVVALCGGMAACGSPSEQSAAKQEATTERPSAAVVDDYAMPRDFAGMDLCVVLSGEAVAAATKTTFVAAKPNTDPVWCTYTVRGDEPYEKEIVVSVDGDGMKFTVGRQTASAAEPVPGLGADAWTKKVGGQRQVDVKRDDDVYVEVIAWDTETAVAVARLALDTIAR